MISFNLLQVAFAFASAAAYDPTWESLDSRPLPSWYPDAKVGIFIHWGTFSVPAFGSEWFWESWAGKKDKAYVDFVDATENHRFNYQAYAPRFDATLYNPDQWADIFASSGAQYVVLTSKHHEGYCMWDSREIPSTWGWNAMDIGPRRDLLGDLAKAVRKKNSLQTNNRLKFGAYHSLFEWFNPFYLQDKKNNFTSRSFVATKILPELYDLVNKYDLDVLWSDGDWEAHSDYWKSTEFLAWLATNSSVKDTIVWNDRWGADTRCKHGSFWNCNDKYLPDGTMSHYFENCMTLDKTSWGANRRSSANDYLTTKELLDTMVQTISRNGNLLVNVGPSADGTINPIMVDRLQEMGRWLSVNGESVYGTRFWTVCSQEQEENVYYTRSVSKEGEEILYAFITEWKNTLTLQCPQPTDHTTAHILGLNETDHPVQVTSSLRGGTTRNSKFPLSTLTLNLPPLTPDLIPCQHVWVVALKGIGNLKVPETALSLS